MKHHQNLIETTTLEPSLAKESKTYPSLKWKPTFEPNLAENSLGSNSIDEPSPPLKFSWYKTPRTCAVPLVQNPTSPSHTPSSCSDFPVSSPLTSAIHIPSKPVQSNEILGEFMKAVANGGRSNSKKGQVLKITPTHDCVQKFVKYSEEFHFRRLKRKYSPNLLHTLAGNNAPSAEDCESVRQNFSLLRKEMFARAHESAGAPSLKKDKRFSALNSVHFLNTLKNSSLIRVSFTLYLYPSGWLLGDQDQGDVIYSDYYHRHLRPYDQASVLFFHEIDLRRIPYYLADMMHLLPSENFYGGGIFVEVRDYRPCDLSFHDKLYTSLLGGSPFSNPLRHPPCILNKANQDSSSIKSSNHSTPTQFKKPKPSYIIYLKPTHASRIFDARNFAHRFSADCERNFLDSPRQNFVDSEASIYGAEDALNPSGKKIKKDAFVNSKKPPNETGSLRSFASLSDVSLPPDLFTGMEPDFEGDSEGGAFCDDQIVRIEKKLVNSIQNPICLNPSGFVCYVANHVHHHASALLPESASQESLSALHPTPAPTLPAPRTHLADFVTNLRSEAPETPPPDALIPKSAPLKPDSAAVAYRKVPELSLPESCCSTPEICDLPIAVLPRVTPCPSATPLSSPVLVHMIHFQSAAGNHILEVKLLPSAEYEGFLRTGPDATSQFRSFSFAMGLRDSYRAYVQQFKRILIQEGNVLVEEKQLLPNPSQIHADSQSCTKAASSSSVASSASVASTSSTLLSFNLHSGRK